MSPAPPAGVQVPVFLVFSAVSRSAYTCILTLLYICTKTRETQGSAAPRPSHTPLSLPVSQPTGQTEASSRSRHLRGGGLRLAPSTMCTACLELCHHCGSRRCPTQRSRCPGSRLCSARPSQVPAPLIFVLPPGSCFTRILFSWELAAQLSQIGFSHSAVPSKTPGLLMAP